MCSERGPGPASRERPVDQPETCYCPVPESVAVILKRIQILSFEPSTGGRFRLVDRALTRSGARAAFGAHWKVSPLFGIDRKLCQINCCQLPESCEGKCSDHERIEDRKRNASVCRRERS